MNQFPFYDMIDTAMQQMMHDPVPKIGSKDFPFDRAVDNKGYAWAGFILPLLDFFDKLKQLMLKIKFEFQLVPGITFVLPCSLICFKQFEK